MAGVGHVLAVEGGVGVLVGVHGHGGGEAQAALLAGVRHTQHHLARGGGAPLLQDRQTDRQLIDLFISLFVSCLFHCLTSS